MPVGSELKNLKEKYPELEVEAVEVIYDYKRAWKDGIRMFPALKIGEDMISGIILTRKAIRKFVKNHLHP